MYSLCPALYPEAALTPREKPVELHPWEKTIKPMYSNQFKHAHNSVKNPEWVARRKQKKERGTKSNNQTKDDKIKLSIIGISTSKEFIYCKNLAKGLHKYRPDVFEAPFIKGLTTVEWPLEYRDIKLKFNDNTYYLMHPVITLANEDFLGGDQELKDFVESKYIYHLCLDYRNEAEKQFYSFVKNANTPFVYLHISIDEKPIGSLIFMLYADVVPKTCANFIRLCTTRRGGYSGSPIHRIVEGGWIQCGGFLLKNTDLGCENFAVAPDKRGVLAMCNDGRGIDCSTQFFVLLQPAEWMKHRYVCFGQLVDGEETLKQIEQVPTYYEAPEFSILICSSGVLDMDAKETINKHSKFYINKHIDDLVKVGEFFTNLLMEHVWAGIEASAKEKKEKRRQKAAQKKQQEEVPSEAIPEDIESDRHESVSSHTSVCDEDKENFTPNQPYIISPLRKKQKPFYLPLSDVPYPEECDSTFDLKKFLRGDYCHESDLDPLKGDEIIAIVRRTTTTWESDLYIIEGQENEDDYELNSSEEEEIRNYVKSNADRVSFAGGVIRQIGVVGKDRAMVNLFEGYTRSEDESEDLFKRRYSMAVAAERRQSMKRASMAFNDEDIRRLRRASAFERRASTVKGRASVSSRRVTVTSTDPGASGVHAETAEQMRKIKNLIEINAYERASKDVDRPSRAASKEVDRLSRAASKEVDRSSGVYDSQTQLTPDDFEKEFSKKKRQTIFAENLARIQSYQKDIPDESDEDDDKKTVSLKLPIGEPDTHEKIKRRQTGYMRPEDLAKMRMSLDEKDKEEEEEEEEEEKDTVPSVRQHQESTAPADRRKSTVPADRRKSARLPEPDEDEERKDSRRITEFDDSLKKVRSTVFSDELERVKSYQKDFSEDSSSSASSGSLNSSGSKTSKVKIDPKSKTDFHTIQRRPTGFIRPCDIPIDIDEDDEDNEEDDEIGPPGFESSHGKSAAPRESHRESEPEFDGGRRETEYDPEMNKKGRLTAFAEDLARIQSYQRDIPSDEGSVDSLEKKVTIDPSSKSDFHTIKRRPTGFIRPSDIPIDVDDEEEDEEEVEKTKPDPSKSQRSKSARPGPDRDSTASAREIRETEEYNRERGKKERTTVFAEELEQVKSFQKDVASDENSSDSEGKKVALKLPPGAAETHEKIKRRQTGYMTKEDLRKMNMSIDDDDEDMEKEIVGAIAATGKKEDEDDASRASTGTIDNRKQRQTFAEDLARIKSYQKDFASDEDEEQAKKVQTPKPSSMAKPKRISDYEGDDDFKEWEAKRSLSDEAKLKVQIDPSAPVKESNINRRATGFVRGPENDEDDEEQYEKGIKESAFLRDYEAAFLDEGKDEPLPTLKTYRPLAERTGSRILNKTLLLPSEGERKLKAAPSSSNELLVRYSLDSDSLEKITSLTFEKIESEMVPKRLSLEYVHTLHKREKPGPHSIRKLEYSSRRPHMSVEEYRKKNAERNEKLKKEGHLQESKDTAPKQRSEQSPTMGTGTVYFSFKSKPQPQLNIKNKSA